MLDRDIFGDVDPASKEGQEMLKQYLASGLFDGVKFHTADGVPFYITAENSAGKIASAGDYYGDELALMRKAGAHAEEIGQVARIKRSGKNTKPKHAVMASHGFVYGDSYFTDGKDVYRVSISIGKGEDTQGAPFNTLYNINNIENVGAYKKESSIMNRSPQIAATERSPQIAATQQDNSSNTNYIQGEAVVNPNADYSLMEPQADELAYDGPTDEEFTQWVEESIGAKDPGENAEVKELLTEDGRLYLSDARVDTEMAQALSKAHAFNLNADTLPRVLDRVAGGNARVRSWLRDFIETPLNTGKGGWARDVQKQQSAAEYEKTRTAPCGL